MSRQHDRIVEIETEEFVLSIVTPRSDRPVDADLADHVRSVLGPLVKRLNLPRIHVMAEGTRVLLHGDVGTETDAELIEEAVASMPPVGLVESHLHIGWIPGDTRPSEGELPPSAMRRALIETAEAMGITGRPALAAVHGTLNAVLNQIPADERTHLVGHFPADVVDLAKARRLIGDEAEHWKSELALDAAAAMRGGISLEEAQVLVPAVIGVIRRFVPEEDADVEATLGRRLRELWDESVDPNVPTAD